MSFFRASPLYSAEPTFTPLFRLLDDFDNYSRASQGNGHSHGHHRAHPKTFSPKFDLKETDLAYELHGELPGIEKDNVHIEFTDPQTIVIRGRTERSYTAGTTPAADGQIENAKANDTVSDEGETTSNKSFQATVEDDETEGASTAQPTPASTNAELEKAQPQPQSKTEEPKIKYWVSERNVGEFSRSFSFPGRIEAEGVKAGLTNGILTVTVPKAKKHESYRVDIN